MCWEGAGNRAPPELADFIQRDRDWRYVQEDGSTASQFYAEACVTFEACVRRAGSVKAVLDAAKNLDRGRVEDFLAAIKFEDVNDLDREIRKLYPKGK